MRSEFLAGTALATTIWFAVPGVSVAQVETIDWSGPYLGLSAGVIASTSSVDIDSGASASVPGTAGLGALSAGVNFPVGTNFVVGIEADGRLATLDTSTQSGGYTIEARLDSLFSLRARFGATAGRFLVYGTAGIAAGQTSSTTVIDNGYGPATAQTASLATGYIGGGGLEYALTDKVSIKGQGLLYGLSSSQGVGDDGYGTHYTSTYKPSGLLVETGLNIRF